MCLTVCLVSRAIGPGGSKVAVGDSGLLAGMQRTSIDVQLSIIKVGSGRDVQRDRLEEVRPGDMS